MNPFDYDDNYEGNPDYEGYLLDGETYLGNLLGDLGWDTDPEE